MTNTHEGAHVRRKPPARAQQRASDRALELLTEHSTDVLCEVREGEITYVSPNAFRVSGRHPIEFEGRRFAEFVHPDDRPKLARFTARGWTGPIEVNFRLKVASGAWEWREARGARTRDEDGTHRGILVLRDITERVELESAIRESERRFRELADGAPFVIYMTDEHFRTVFVNKAMLSFTGRTFDEQLAVPLGVNRHPDDAGSLRKISSEAIARRERFTCEQRYRNAEGEYRWLMTDAQPRLDQAGKYAGYIGYSIDITARRNAENALRESEERLRCNLLAEHERARRDPLTGVLNHGAISEELKALMTTGTRGAVFMIDVDALKAVNDTFGHQMGDAVLQAVAGALQRSSAIVGRYGGDEFVVILPAVGRRQAEAYRDDVTWKLSAADLRDAESGARVPVAASIGVALFPAEAARVEELMQLADDAMYASKRERTLGANSGADIASAA